MKSIEERVTRLAWLGRTIPIEHEPYLIDECRGSLHKVVNLALEVIIVIHSGLP